MEIMDYLEQAKNLGWAENRNGTAQHLTDVVIGAARLSETFHFGAAPSASTEVMRARLAIALGRLMLSMAQVQQDLDIDPTWCMQQTFRDLKAQRSVAQRVSDVINAQVDETHGPNRRID